MNEEFLLLGTSRESGSRSMNRWLRSPHRQYAVPRMMVMCGSSFRSRSKILIFQPRRFHDSSRFAV
jgi:hypothetical protein